MKFFKGDMLTLIGKVDVLCVTTNGFTKNNGNCVMGRGIALQISMIYEDIPQILGNEIRSKGNIPHLLKTVNNTHIYSFPVKTVYEKADSNNSHIVKHMRNKFKIGDIVPGWACVASPELISNSAFLLSSLADKEKWNTIALPKVGCGAGELNWNEVEPILRRYFNDRFIICDFK